MPWPSSADDPALKLIRDEEIRQNSTIQLIASENFASPATMAATGSVLTNKYSEGYPGKRYYGGNMVVDQLEDLARDRICEEDCIADSLPTTVMSAPYSDAKLCTVLESPL